MDRILDRMHRGMMIILIGQRRVGKSYMLKQVLQWVNRERPRANSVYINMELQKYRGIKDADTLYRLAKEQLPEGEENYLLIDEVQDIPCYENALRSLHAEGVCQIIATGSNAYVFSSELSTRLSGRYLEIPVHSLSYREFLKFHDLTDNDGSLESYLRVGGLPGLRHFDIQDDSQIQDFMQGVYNTVMMRDVVARERIRNVAFIENLSRFVADNIGKPISVRNIANFVTNQGGEEVTPTLTNTYLRYLRNALIVQSAPRYDIRGKKLFEQNLKYYFADHGLRNFLCGFNLCGSIEKVIENVVYNHLLAQGYNVTVGVLRRGEVDFVATRRGRTMYVQAAYLLGSQETVEREFGNLKAIPDDNPKLVVSMDPFPGQLAEYPGIEHVPLRKFLATDC